MNIKVLLFFFALSLPWIAQAQISEEQSQKIDQLFADWNKPNHPGGSIGVMKDGKVIFSKAYGLASLEYLVPNTSETIFNTASVSKQFTSMGILILQELGELSIDDDIRKHLPDLPDFGEKITIRHLMHHTSGLRSLHAMLALAGWREDDSRTNEDLYRFMLNQKELNFKPGDDYLYCNTGYILMAKIIEKISGESFASWMKQHIFTPLGMIHTYVEDQYYRVVPQNATSYYEDDGKFVRAVEYWGYVGSGNMHSTTNDLLKWLKNFHSPQPHWESAFKLLRTLDPLNNGQPNNYAFGVTVGEFLGTPRIEHSGAIGGFRSQIVSYPEQKLDIAILTNYSRASPTAKVEEVAKLFLEDNKNTASNDANDTPKPDFKFIKLSTAQLKKFEGAYWYDKGAYARKIYMKDDTLRYFRGEGNESKIAPISENEFRMLEVGTVVKIKFETNQDGSKTMLVDIPSTPTYVHSSYEENNPTAKELAAYTGTFYSPELETTYRIYMKDDQLKWYHTRHGEGNLKFLKDDILEGTWPFAIVHFQRNPQKEITGVRVSNGRVLKLWFEKIEGKAKVK